MSNGTHRAATGSSFVFLDLIRDLAPPAQRLLACALRAEDAADRVTQ